MDRLFVVAFVAFLALSVCAPSWAQDDVDVEMICVSALADEANVDMSKIESTGKAQAGEGTVVHLTLDKKSKWDCYVNDDGKVTQLESKSEGGE